MINLRTPLNDLGYGIVGINLLKELDKLTDVVLFPIGQPNVHQSYHTLIQKCFQNQEKFYPYSPTLTIWHEHSLHERIGKGKNVALPFFELNKFPIRTKKSLSSQDEIIVPSLWAKNIIYDQINGTFGISQINVITMGVDTDFYQPMNLISENKPYRFLNVGKTEIRKGHDVLVEIFNSAFTEEDDVELYIAWDNPFMQPQDKKTWVDLYKESHLGNKIHFIPRQQSLKGEYCSADCLIQSTRAEAICLPILEAMACGKPIITTNYSGMTAFCNKDNSFSVDIDELEPAFDGFWFKSESLDDGGWAKFGDKQITQFVEYMRHCYKNKVVTNICGRTTAEKLSWTNVAKNVLEVLNANA